MVTAGSAPYSAPTATYPENSASASTASGCGKPTPAIAPRRTGGTASGTGSSFSLGSEALGAESNGPVAPGARALVAGWASASRLQPVTIDAAVAGAAEVSIAAHTGNLALDFIPPRCEVQSAGPPKLSTKAHAIARWRVTATLEVGVDREPAHTRSTFPLARVSFRCANRQARHEPETHQVRVRHGRSRLVDRQGARQRIGRRAARGARAARHARQARPVHQRRSGHDEPVPARRGLRHRRRRRDRPRPRPLRALHHRADDAAATTSRPAASTRRSSRRSGAASTSARRCRSSRTSPTRSKRACRDATEGASTSPSSRSAAPSATSSRSRSSRPIRQMKVEAGPQNALSMHVTLVPYIATAGELKTKPTQHSVKEMREIGIQPDVLHLPHARCRSRKRRRRRSRSSRTCPSRRSSRRSTSSCIYEVPLMLPHRGARRADRASASTSGAARPISRAWQRIVERFKKPARGTVKIGDRRQVRAPEGRVQVAARGARPRRARERLQGRPRVHRLRADRAARAPETLLAHLDAVLVPGGFGDRGTEGKIAAIGYAREQQDPVLRHLPRHADRGRRVRAQRRGPRRRELDRVRPRHAARRSST